MAAVSLHRERTSARQCLLLSIVKAVWKWHPSFFSRNKIKEIHRRCGRRGFFGKAGIRNDYMKRSSKGNSRKGGGSPVRTSDGTSSWTDSNTSVPMNSHTTQKQPRSISSSRMQNNQGEDTYTRRANARTGNGTRP